MQRRTQLTELPELAIRDRRVTLRRVLGDLPEPLLAALISGLEIHGDNLCAGRLFQSHTSSCAAGAMIRQLNPDEFHGGRLQFLLRHRWRKRVASYGGELRAGMHATMIESCFDRAVFTTLCLVPDARKGDASRLVGQWFLAEAERELQIRDDRRSAGLAPVVDWRNERLRRWDEDLERRLAAPLGSPVSLASTVVAGDGPARERRAGTAPARSLPAPVPAGR